ncbi:hypothetical protein Tco_0678747 [Tanacetum coccineum]|uniref:Uncharacterized protein n=1 Tax=Tanacetum coccineum TaxID=301880 RepID=A0ABQ4XFX6_9ASTR
MATPKKNHNEPCLSKLAEPRTNNNNKIGVSKEILIMLQDHTYDGAETKDAADHVTKFLEIIDIVKIPNINKEQLYIFAFPYSLIGNASRWWMHEDNDKITSWEKGYDNNILADNDESSNDEHIKSNNSPISNPSDKEEGNKSHHSECNSNSNLPDNFEIEHSEKKEKPGNETCRMDKFEVIKYSISDNEEFMGLRTLERHSWAQTTDGVSSVYLDIFRKKDEGWTVTRTK